MSENINVDENRLKITFADKIDSWTLTSQKEYVLTADNINEIKRVVNSISLELQGMDHFSSIYKYARFIVPTSLSRGATYDFEIQMSSDPSFGDSANITSLKLSDAPDKFYKFVNGQWIKMALGSFSIDDIGVSFRADIEQLLAHKHAPYFGRYRLIGLAEATPYEMEWNGFSLGAFDYKDIAITDAPDEIKSIYITGPSSITEKAKGTFTIKGVKRNGEVVDVASNYAFTTTMANDIINQNEITFSPVHRDAVDIVIAEATFTAANGNVYSLKAALPILIKAVFLERLDVNLSGGNELKRKHGA